MPTILHDKFYTPEPTARKCVGDLWRTLGMRTDDLFIEPSAGAGAFCRHLPTDRLIALDIMPEAEGIATGDFLDFAAPSHAGRRIVIGNPPFGCNGALARAFLRHAMGFADIVAFILPASFAKPSMQRGIDRRFHLVHQSSLVRQSFETSDGSHVVNTVFQIWERRDTLREDDPDPVHQADFEFVRDIRDADLVVRRVGARAGAVLEVPAMIANEPVPTGYAPNSNYYIKATGCDPALLERRMKSLDLADLARDAVCPSLSKRDLIAAYVAAPVQKVPSEAPVCPARFPKTSLLSDDPESNYPVSSTKPIHVIIDHSLTGFLPAYPDPRKEARNTLQPSYVSGPKNHYAERQACMGRYHAARSWNAVPPEPPPPGQTVWHGISPQPPDRCPHASSPANDPCPDMKRTA